MDQSHIRLFQLDRYQFVIKCGILYMVGLIAQLVEHGPFKPGVVGSRPTQPTIHLVIHRRFPFCAPRAGCLLLSN